MKNRRAIYEITLKTLTNHEENNEFNQIESLSTMADKQMMDIVYI